MNIVEIIKSYVKKPSTDYALMLTGEWGSGKTYYWKNKIVPELEKITNPETGKNYRCIYVSLNGVKEVSQILHRLFQVRYRGQKTKY